MDPNACVVGLRIGYGGKFKFVKEKVEYIDGKVCSNSAVSCEDISVQYLRNMAELLMGTKEVEIWYKKSGKNLTTGKTLLVSQFDIVNAIKSRDKNGVIFLYFTQPTMAIGAISTPLHSPRTKSPNVERSKTATYSVHQSSIPSKKCNFNADIDGPSNTKSKNSIFTAPRQELFNKNSLPIKRSLGTKTHSTTTFDSQPTIELPLKDLVSNSFHPKSMPKLTKLPLKRNLKLSVHSEKLVKHTNENEEIKYGDNSGEIIAMVDEVVKGKGKEKVCETSCEYLGRSNWVRNEEVRRNIEDWEELPCGEIDFIDSDCSDGCNDSDVEWKFGEEDLLEEDELLDISKSALGFESGELEVREPTILGVDDLEVSILGEADEESDDLKSLQGSDDETDLYPTFNQHTDFGKPINLKVGLKFPGPSVLRKALVFHAVQNGYDYSFLHNGNTRISTYCVDQCKCRWNEKRSRRDRKNCKCEEKDKCYFKVHSERLKQEKIFQIISMELYHKCAFSTYNRKVTSQFLADYFIKFWRINFDWKLNHFKAHVKKELNVEVTYAKCWLARSRAKLIIYGNSEDQFARIWDYAAVIRKYNVGSTSIVVCDGIDRPPVYFRRIYVCLKACKEGFIKGCRPIVGVDGCHLKGVYSGMILTAVGKDGNKNIFPVAWAVVEVENADSWKWFLELLIDDIGAHEGEGMTFMSDRQKGLVDALSFVVPKAEIRYCVRHIWPNFKLRFTGEVYKNIFWSAARANTKVEFERQMGDMKSVSEEAWVYLNNIPANHWSRHAFSTHCKSNMLLNNICESFNNAIKEARDKPILTLMEWLRRYVMKRNYEKRKGVEKYKGNLMPYVQKYINWSIEESRRCVLTPSTLDKYEIGHYDRFLVVKLDEKTCSCFHWNLTGLPCPHAMACILNQRLKPEDFVDEVYHKQRYALAYEPSISPMPGVKDWDKTYLPEPLPPPIKQMPGRPPAKKRKKELGEGSSRLVKRAKKPNKCSHCGQLGHNKKKCKNDPAPPKQPYRGGKPLKTDAWSVQRREKAAKLKAAKEAHQLSTQSARQSAGPTTSQIPTRASTLE